MNEGFDLFTAFATDEVKENEGVDVPIGGGATLKIARMGNPSFEKMLLAETEANKVALETLPEKEALELDREIYRRVLASTILVGWSGAGYKGKGLPYTVENAIKMLKMPDFRKLVVRHASGIELFRAKLEVAEVKK